MTSELSAAAQSALAACGVDLDTAVGVHPAEVLSPITGTAIASVPRPDAAGVQRAIDDAYAAYETWRDVPGPVRGNAIKALGRILTEHKEDLAELVTLEVGKIRSEALGEVQEMIDICDYAVGLSRMLGGSTMPSERPGHRLMETWHPRGVVTVISAFNFPVAVWSWNTTIALVCGNAVVWKPSENTPLTALACDALLRQALLEVGAPTQTHRLVLADRADADALLDDPRVGLVSATGSERMGREVGPRVATRFGTSLLELGGNNAAIVTGEADLDLAVRGIVFSAAGTAGQRCTTMRRIIAHESIAEELTARLTKAFAGLPIGDPRDEGTLVGPLINEAAFEKLQAAIAAAQADGGELLVGGGRHEVPGCDGFYAQPAIVRMPAQTQIVQTETFAPLLYVMTYRELDEAIALNNAVPQGLSSSIFTLNVREAEQFMSASGSDCGIANVNIGTSGAEIGGAFGGEKSTGGGRESGSDAWKSYMRRATNTINYSAELPLAQGVNFG